MAKRRPPPLQSWKTFLKNHVDGIASIDLFVVPTVGFRLLFGLVILSHDRRQLMHTAVSAHPTPEWIANQIAGAFPWDTAPRHLIRDRDAVYGGAYRRRVSAMGIRDGRTAPRSPWQDGYVERLIGSIRHECLDHTIIFGEAHLRRVLRSYSRYYNGMRTHLSLAEDTPLRRPTQRTGRIQFVRHLGGLHHSLARI